MAQEWPGVPVGAAPTAPPPPPTYGAPGVIYGAPDPYKQSAEQRAQQDQAMQAQAAARDAARLGLAEAKDARDQENLTESQGKAAGLLQRAIHANGLFEESGVGPRSFAGEIAARKAPMLKNYSDDPARQAAVVAQRDFISAILRVESGAAVSQSEFDNYAKIYFPQPGDKPETLKAKADERRAAMAALQLQAGPQGKDLVIPLSSANGEDGTQRQGDARTASLALWGQEVFDDKGNPLGPEGGEGFDKGGNSLGLFTHTTDDSQSTYGRNIAAQSAKLNAISGQPGGFDLAKQGITLGLSDEAAGVGTAISGALQGNFNVEDNYNFGRDVANYRLNEARNNLGWIGGGIEALGGMASLGAGVPASIAQAAKGGAIAGGVGGFGYGEGNGRVANAFTGAALGGALGAGGQWVGNAIGGSAAEKAATAQIDNATNRAVADAGQAEGVTVNRAMMDPTGNRNRIYRADASIAGGRTVQRGMERIEGQIQNRVTDLGQGGAPLTSQQGGSMLEDAGARVTQRTKDIKDAKYQRADRLAGGAQVEARQTVQAVDDMLAELGQNPNKNSEAINYLNGLKQDLSGPKSTSALREIQSDFRSQLRNRNIVLNQEQARSAQFQQAIAEDIQTGLTQQGRGAAAKAYQSADKAYAARQNYIEGTIQRLIGKPGSNTPPEQVFSRFQSMAKGKDAGGLRRLYASLTPEEKIDVAATFADQLGKNNKGDFTVTQFLRQTEGFSDSALVTIFGSNGAQSIKNLRTLGKRVEDVTGAMNSRKSGTAPAGYRGYLLNLLFGGGGVGVATGNVSTGAAVGVGLAGVKGTTDLLSARLLMSPRIAKWLSSAPATTSAQAIDRHFNRLADIAKAEPALVADIERLRSAIYNAANDNFASSAAASDQQKQQ